MKWLTLKMRCYWPCSHDRKYIFFFPSSVQPTQWSSDLNDQKWVWRQNVCFLLCMWTDTWMRWVFFSPLAALMASYWWPRVMKLCHLSCSPWRHHCRTTALWVYSKASTHLNKTIRLILSAKAHWVEIHLHKKSRSILHPPSYLFGFFF